MTSRVPPVRVEFYGLARLRAGRAEIQVEAATLGEALAAVAAACPTLQVVRDGRLSPQYLASVGAGPFVTDPNHPLGGQDALIIMGADAGG